MLAQITLTGIVGKDPVLQEFDNAKKATFSVATTEKRGVEIVTTWYDCEVWNDNTEIVMDRIKKKQRIIVKGQLSLRPYFSKKHKKEMTQALVRMTSFEFAENNNRVKEVRGA